MLSLKRALLLVLALAVAGWAIALIASLWQSTTLLRDLGSSVRARSLDFPSATLAEPPPTIVADFPSDGSSSVDGEHTEISDADTTPTEAPGEAQYVAVQPSMVPATSSPTRAVAVSPPVPARVRCENFYRPFGIFASDTEGHSSDYLAMSDAELQALADIEGHGHAQYMYAYDRLLGLAIAQPIGQRDTALARAKERLRSPDDPLLTTAKHYLINAIRNHNWSAAEVLSEIYKGVDKIESRAWAVVSHQAGGRRLTLEEREGLGLTEFLNDEEKRRSEDRAQELILEFDLAAGLAPPEQCM